MIKKLICFLFGHKNIVKASTGNTFQTINQLTGLEQTGHYYRWEKQKFCLRCGKDLIDDIKLELIKQKFSIAVDIYEGKLADKIWINENILNFTEEEMDIVQKQFKEDYNSFQNIEKE